MSNKLFFDNLTSAPPRDSTQPLLKGRYERSVAEMYDQDDLSSCSLFAGHFINFGFWERLLNEKKINLKERIESEKNLYRYVVNEMGISEFDKVLEVGCGQGVGTSLVLTEFNPSEIHGIDLSKAQISRAIKINQQLIKEKKEKIHFQQGSAEDLPFSTYSFDKIFSVEAAQHFSDLKKFASEAYFVLKPKGTLAIASFFGTRKASSKLLAPMIQTVRDGIDHIVSVHEFEKILKEVGFNNIKIKSIGEHVWEGFDRWTSQGDLKDSWTRHWYQGYKKHLIDYYLIIAEN